MFTAYKSASIKCYTNLFTVSKCLNWKNLPVFDGFSHIFVEYHTTTTTSGLVIFYP